MDVPHYLTTTEADPALLTPVMRQVVEAKRNHPGALVLFRLGDFYELFFEDALEATRLLDLTLTSRNKNDPRPIPMCGFPYHAMAGYVQRILEAGRRAAVCEQLTDPSQTKGIVQRGVTHVLTPGVVLETEALDAQRANHVVALHPGRRGGLGVAVADVSTGEVRWAQVPHPAALGVLLVRLEPREIILTSAARPWLDGLGAVREVLQTERELPNPPPREATAEQAALALLQAYLGEVRPGIGELLAPPQPLDAVAHMSLGREAVLHLELLATARLGRRHGSLLDAVDRTRTAAGSRMLRALLLAPLCDRRAIELRHAAVQALLEDRPARERLRDLLKHQCDLARTATRIAARLVQPRELAALRATLLALPAVRASIAGLDASVALVALRADLDGAESIAQELQAALADAPRMGVADGGVMRPGFDAALDELVQLTEHGQEWLAAFEATERSATGISTLKVTYNRVTGYGLEIGRAKADAVPAHYHRKQTLKNTERYTTDALVTFERKLQSAEHDRVAREAELYRQLCERLAAQTLALRRMAAALADLDVHAGFAEIAAEWRYVRPRMVDVPVLLLRGCRHPVVEQLLAPVGFVPNDIDLRGQDELDADLDLPVADDAVKASQVLLITGPNMAGKSTLMRQVALATILAQSGGFVPADAAVLGVLDGVQTRIGAGDDISEGASTFMVEMRETAEILQRATPRTLVLLDEIGRGTSTDDGLAIAWAVVESLHDKSGSLCLFATHYHELTELSDRLPRLQNAHVAVREWGQDIVFVHRLQPGPTSRSHGIAVARLAGLAPAVVTRARALLIVLEKRRSATAQEANRTPGRQLGLFDAVAAPAPSVDPAMAATIAALQHIDMDELSPRQAYDRLAAIVAMARGLELPAG